MQILHYLKLPWNTYIWYKTSVLPFRNFPFCQTRTTSILIKFTGCTYSQPLCKLDISQKDVSRHLHIPLKTVPSRSHTCPTMSLQHTKFNSLHKHHCESSVAKSVNEWKISQLKLANHAESMYQTLVKNHPWLYPYSRTVAFSKKKNIRKLQDVEPEMKSTEMENLIMTIMNSLDNMDAASISSVYLDFNHAGLEKTHTLMTNLFTQLHVKWESVDFLSLGRYLSAVEHYNGSHILIEMEILPKFQCLLQNDQVRYEDNPKEFLQVLCQLSSHGILQRTENDLVSDLLLQILSLCLDDKVIGNDLDLVVPVFELVSLFLLGDDRLTFIESNIHDICEKILKQVTAIMLKNVQQLNLRQLCAVLAMSGEEQMEFLSKPFLENIQARMEFILFETQHFSSYNILELQQLANLSWMKISADGRDRLVNLTWECLQSSVEEDHLPLEMIMFLKRSGLVSDMLLDIKIPLSVKQSLKQAILDVDILKRLEPTDFIDLYDIVSMFFSTKNEDDIITQQLLSEVRTNPTLKMTGKLPHILYTLLINRERHPAVQNLILNKKVVNSYNLYDFKKLINFTARCFGDIYYHNLHQRLNKIFCREGRERSLAQNNIHQLFLLGWDRSYTSNYVKLCGIPSWRLQQRFRDLTYPAESLDQDVLEALTYLCYKGIDHHQIEVACLMVLCLPTNRGSLLYNILVDYALKNQAAMKASNHRDLLQIIVRAGPTFTEAKVVIQMANDFIEQSETDDMDPRVLLQMLRSMSEFKVFPQHCIKKVFQKPYFNKLLELLQSTDLSYNQSTLLLDNIIRVNRAVCLLYPEYGVPYLQELIESPSEPDINTAVKSDDVHAKLIYLLHKQCMVDVLSAEFGPEFVHTNHKTAGLNIDIAVYFDENLDVVKHSQLDEMEKAGKHYKKLAVLCLEKKDYNLITKGKTMEVEQKRDLLIAQGYTVIATPCWKNEKYKILMERAQHLLFEIYGSVGNRVM
ncbi:uncharacterized protein LOC132547595 [Ylistrum balloti]|uniref:uncharacterized protein LOC132547595 n=1 Tax=Ylistrum balloti TaxID=509963 RepID=UPI002905D850|nr:uncharacterized protein LOC132547595 [Ylistrum balloti]